ncbi:aminotransferase class V-fold PLP-dependent enzyme [Haloplasma contractile]|uniref:Selenocysteine lyase protein n=1 Tax=Haloplasma contractile SSD-17B TaxID=1033810 RepID=F7Q0L0_9MOLU|nr:aminotransferase class V-fold PLP-dependent enzyme [Haloplasma contractile]ERJ12645.1 selenocysteine lyase protein [Haloplasma contractile SSD-17B]
MEINFEFLRHQLIGNDVFCTTPYGKRLITYADYTASGKTLGFIERYLIDIQKVYANTHTDDSYTGKTMTDLLHKAEQKIKSCVGANKNHHIISVGSGSTGAITRLCKILGLYLTPGLKYNIDQHLKQNNNRYDADIIKNIFEKMTDSKPVIFVSPYEHHSNYLIWIESFAEVVEITLNNNGMFNYTDLEQKLQDPRYKNRIKIGSFSAASNITGIKTDVHKVAKIMHKNNGLAFFDYAASAPYVKININKDNDEHLDAVFISPHKFVGGPGSSGILIFNKNLYSNLIPPTVAAGGTVDFVSPYCYEFMKDVEAREKAGTPGILQTLKASLAFELKNEIGTERIEKIEKYYIQKVINRLRKHNNIDILGPLDPSKRIAILSFNIRHNNKKLHHKFVTTLLNDLFGIQSRAGCACAGPYGHRLLGITKETSMIIRDATKDGLHSLKPGFVRVNFHFLIEEYEVNFIISAIEFIASYGYLFLNRYSIDLKTGSWSYINAYKEPDSLVKQFGIHHSFDRLKKDVFEKSRPKKQELYKYYLTVANQESLKLKTEFKSNYKRFKKLPYESIRWFDFINQED